MPGATARPAPTVAFSLAHWSTMRETSGEMTTVTRSATSAGSWYVTDLPLPVGQYTHTSRP